VAYKLALTKPFAIIAGLILPNIVLKRVAWHKNNRRKDKVVK